MKSKIVGLLAIITAIAFVIFGCGSSAGEGNGELKKAALLTTGPVNDGGWNQMAYEGLVELEGMGFDIANTENVTQGSVKNAIKAYADQGYNLIIGHGFEFGDGLVEAANEYSDIKFLQIGGARGGEASNLASAEFRGYELGYIGGKVGAELTKSKKYGFIGASKIPTVSAEVEGIKAGVKESDPTIEVIDVYTGSWTDIAAGKKVAEQLINQGVDVILGISDACDAGVIQAIEEGNAAGGKIQFIGWTGDFYKSYQKDFIATSCVQEVSKVIAKAGKDYKDEKFEGKPWIPGFADGMMHLGEWSPAVPAEVKTKIDGIQKDLQDGKITKKDIFKLTGLPEFDYQVQKGE